MASTRYSLAAMAMHWLAALLILAAIAMGVVMTELGMSPARLKLYNWHKWVGISLLALSVLRLLWRALNPPPASPPMARWQQAAATATHAGLYALFFGVPLLGWAYSSASGFPVVAFGVLPLPDLVAPDKSLAQSLQAWHANAALALGALVALHVAAALKHHFVDRDGMLWRMFPGSPQR